MITNKIAVIGAATQLERLTHIDVYSQYQIALSIIDGKVKFELLDSDKQLYDYDAIGFRHSSFARGLGQAIYYVLRKRIHFFDAKRMQIPVVNKLNATIICANRGVRVPNTLFYPRRKLNNVKTGAAILSRIFSLLGDVVVMKDIYSHRGKANFLVRSVDDIRQVLQTNPKGTFMFQEFIPNDFDLRLLVIYNKTESCTKRTRHEKDEHRNNISIGATGTIMDVDQLADYALIAQKITRTLEQEIAGVDLMQSTENGLWYFLESNYSPQIDDESQETEAFRHYYVS